MKTIVTTFNAKYIHKSLALRLLYVANRDRMDITFLECTIKEDAVEVARKLVGMMPQVVGIGVYIWNVEHCRRLVEELRSYAPGIFIVLGGPEVTYEPEYFIINWGVDYVVSGEGEFALGELIEQLERGNVTPEIQGVSYKGNISQQTAIADLEKLASMPSPYTLECDREETRNRINYIETSRGCPYQCSYCLSSLEKGVRYFPQQYILSNIQSLIDSGARQLKFLDRTFNLNQNHTEAIYNLLLENYRRDLSCQFEVYADILSDQTVEWLNSNLPAGFFRFEIGIQSTYQPTNEAVNRRLNIDKLSRNIERIVAGGKIDLHLDLIAGLPYETFDLFVRSFNDVFSFRAKELQLGFLKMLRGTSMRRDAVKHGYWYSETAPYQVISNNYITAAELEEIHDAEHALEKFWNSGRFSRTMNRLFDTAYSGRYFDFFHEMGRYYREHNLPHHGYQLEELFATLHNFLTNKRINLLDEMRRDYYDCFSVRPKTSFLPQPDKLVKKRWLALIAQDKEFMARHMLTQHILRKHTSIDRITDNRLRLTVFEQAENGGVNRREVEFESDCLLLP